MKRRKFLSYSTTVTAAGTLLPASVLFGKAGSNRPHSLSAGWPGTQRTIEPAIHANEPAIHANEPAIHLGAQYYRAPFPRKKHWKDDLFQMADSGMNTVQFWVLWGWVEPSAGEFHFDDYDELIRLAGEAGLKVVISTIAAIQPLWIHRQVPGSELVDNFGKKVISSNREETHFGITPGGCFDHPGVQERMDLFFRTVVNRYKTESHLHGWDVWNELRWGVNSDGLVCFCKHTVDKYHRWLKEHYQDLKDLNEQWNTRYIRWEDIRPPKVPRSPYTDDLFYGQFMMDRASRHGWHRYKVVKSEDPGRAVTLHGGQPTPFFSGRYDPDHNLPRFPMWRGNDWTFAEKVDAIGTSSFPKLFQDDDLRKFTMRIDFTRSARSGKRIWMSELQGGRGNLGFQLAEPVRAAEQQRWVWTGISQGVDTILFWCWRDEVFGQESDGYGISGNDGFSSERLAAMKETGKVLGRERQLLSGFQLDKPEVGIWFGPRNYFLHWAQNKRGDQAMNAILGYADALLKMKIPYRIVEENHLEELEGLRVLFMPGTFVLSDDQEQALLQFVEDGGVLFCESWTGAFTREGFYRYPENRFLCRNAGILEIGRRLLPDNRLVLSFRDESFVVEAEKWITPMQLVTREDQGSNAEQARGEERARGEEPARGEERARGEEPISGEKAALIREVAYGKGRIIACGTFCGNPYWERGKGQLPELAGQVCKSAGIQPVFRLTGDHSVEVQVKSGTSGLSVGSSAKRVHFILAETDRPVELEWLDGATMQGNYRELLTGETITLKNTGGKHPKNRRSLKNCRALMQLPESPWGVWVLAEI